MLHDLHISGPQCLKYKKVVLDYPFPSRFPSLYFLPLIFSQIHEDNKSRVSGRIQARLHRPLSRCLAMLGRTKLVIG